MGTVKNEVRRIIAVAKKHREMPGPACCCADCSQVREVGNFISSAAAITKLRAQNRELRKRLSFARRAIERDLCGVHLGRIIAVLDLRKPLRKERKP